MKNIWTIVKKELSRVFTDKGMIISLFILPPLTIYIIYGLMGMSAENENKKIEAYESQVYVVNAPEAFKIEESDIPGFESYLNNSRNSNDYKTKYPNSLVVKSIINYVDEDELEATKDKLKKEEIELIIEFTDNFEELAVLNQVDNKPEIKLHYNINMAYSQSTYYDFQNFLTEYNNQIASTRVDFNDLKVFIPTPEPIGDTDKATGTILGMILPMLLILYLFTGAMSIGMESVAGEKERGTIATLLVTPIKRSELAIGKIISISIISVLSSVASFLGLLAVMPQFAKIGGGDEELFGKLTYGISDYGMLFGVMFVAVLMFVGLIVIISTVAKSTKQAGTLITPLMLVIMGISFFNMFTQEVSQDRVLYLVPIYNLSLVLKAIFQFDIEVVNWLLTVLSTFGYTIILIFLIQRMFKSEKIMFNK